MPVCFDLRFVVLPSLAPPLLKMMLTALFLRLFLVKPAELSSFGSVTCEAILKYALLEVFYIFSLE